MPTDATAERPATSEEIISAFSKQHGIPPALALAVAQRESGTQDGIVGDGGKAIGMFQLHEAAAKDVGVDRTDPFQNIEGGIKYLKQLSDRYNGDVNKVLMAYNGGMTNVDAGTVSPEAQAYAADVMANLSQGLRKTATARPAQGGRGAGGAGPVGRGGPAGPAVGTAGADPSFGVTDIGKALVQPFDPRTPDGRVNLATTAATIGTSVLTDGATAVAPWIVRVLGPPVAAALAGGGERAVEQKIGTTPASATGPIETGAWQAAYELGGQAFMWPIRRLARTFLGKSVGTAAKRGLDEQASATALAGRDAISAARTRAAEHTEAARLLAQADTMAERARVAPHVRAASQRATADTLALKDQTSARVEAAKSVAARRLADAELDQAATVERINGHYAAVNQPPPSQATADAVNAVVNRGVRSGEQKGAAQIALDIAGKKVREAAKGGPRVKVGPLQDALERMRAGIEPDELIPSAGEKQIPGMGFTASALQSASPTRLKDAEFQKAIVELQNAIATEGGAAHPLPKVLGLIQQAPMDDMSFETAHKLKGLLDQTVNWDEKARGTVQRLTKGIRVALRKEMSGYAPYDQATRAYANLVPLYEDGIGKKIIKSAQTDPDSLMHLFDVEKPLQAKAARDLLINQSAAGGNPEAGIKAWDAVRAAFTHKKIISGDPAGLADRVRELVTQHPEFAKTVYHDQAGQQILTNLETLGESITDALQREAANVAATKEAGKGFVKTATRDASRTLATGKTNIEIARQGVRDRAAEAIRQVRDRGQVLVRDVQRQGSEAVADEQHQAGVRNAAVDATKARFRASSIASGRTLADTGADAIHAVAGGGTWFQARAALRFLKGPKAADILEWAAFSPRNTRRTAQLLMGQLPDRLASGVLRDMAQVVAPEQKKK